MSWETTPWQVRASSSAWRITVKKTGISIMIPVGHPLGKSPCVITQQGKGDDIGWIRLLPSTIGRKVLVPSKRKATEKTPRFIRYSTLPGAPGLLNVTQLEVKSNADGSVVIKLPWRVPGAPFSMVSR
jgi:hypothetical protein